MMTRKMEREKRRKKAKKPFSLMMERGGQESNGKDCAKDVQGEVQVLRWCKVYLYCLLLFL